MNRDSSIHELIVALKWVRMDERELCDILLYAKLRFINAIKISSDNQSELDNCERV